MNLMHRPSLLVSATFASVVFFLVAVKLGVVPFVMKQGWGLVGLVTIGLINWAIMLVAANLLRPFMQKMSEVKRFLVGFGLGSILFGILLVLYSIFVPGELAFEGGSVNIVTRFLFVLMYCATGSLTMTLPYYFVVFGGILLDRDER